MNSILENTNLLLVASGFILALSVLLWSMRNLLTNKQEKLQETNLEKLELILNPLKDQIQGLNKQIVELQKEQAAAKESFRNNVSQVIEQTSKIRVDAENLTAALKGDSKTQGDWGEMILEKTLEESGLRKGKDYELQKAFRDVNGKLLIPDAIIYLPGERNIIIDSKVSLKAYQQYSQAKDDEKAIYLKAHIKSLKDHMKVLAEKDYKNLDGINAPDYQLIFVPLESALSLALSNEWELQKIAMQSHIGFVTPTNLITVLRMAESLWALDKQNKNALEISKRAGLLINKFVGLQEDLEDIERYFKQAEEAFDKTKTKLYQGKGNLVDQARELELLGAKAKKTIEDKS
ncbi:MAG: DNA recombination protein RmuC [Gammaproteobacteria bacterium]